MGPEFPPPWPAGEGSGSVPDYQDSSYDYLLLMSAGYIAWCHSPVGQSGENPEHMEMDFHLTAHPGEGTAQHVSRET